jgi:hypothetical protein
MIQEEELLHRAIKPKALFWNEKTGKVTSALFKDSKGVSVDINNNRIDVQVKDFLQSQFPDLKGEARVKTKLCREKNCRVKFDPIENNENHALILGEINITLTSGQAKYLSKNCVVVLY